MKRSVGLVVLLALAILSIVAVVSVTGLVRVETTEQSKDDVTASPPAESDAGALDSLLDGVRIDHQMKHGR